MFNRESPGYLDNQILDQKILSRFDDKYSARYLHLCFSPEFIMRVRERDKPEFSVNIGGLDKYTFNNGKSKEEIV